MTTPGPGGITTEQFSLGLPTAVRNLVGDGTWELVLAHPSGRTEWRIVRGAGTSAELIVAPGGTPDADRLREEHRRLHWLRERAAVNIDGDHVSSEPSSFVMTTERLPAVPSLLDWVAGTDANDAYLVTAPVPGSSADGVEHLGDVETLLRALAHGLRDWHAQPVPPGAEAFDRSPEVLVALAAQRVGAGQVASAQFDPPYRRYEPEALLDMLAATRTPEPDAPVVAHGAPTLRSTQVSNGRVVAYRNLVDSGVGDRYVDLAVLAAEIASRISGHAVAPFFDDYGIEVPDVHRLDFYVLLSQFFRD